jgi:hypothetical protein
LRGRELVRGVPSEFGHVGEADKRGLLAAPERGDLAIDKVGCELDVEPAGGPVALHGLNLTRETKSGHSLSFTLIRRKFSLFKYRAQQRVLQHLLYCISIKCTSYFP